jgi:hypothetical protein
MHILDWHVEALRVLFPRSLLLPIDIPSVLAHDKKTLSYFTGLIPIFEKMGEPSGRLKRGNTNPQLLKVHVHSGASQLYFAVIPS